MNKRFATGLIFICALFESLAQPNVADWAKKFEAYQSSWPKTKLHLIFNQEKFSPGDTAWFKAYFLTEDLSGITGKQLIDLNLVDSRGESKLHFIFNTNNGLGQNQLAIPETLSAGIYFVTACSSWMKNFDPAFIFKKEIVIVRKNEVVPDEKFEIAVFAEGGHLIRDASNKIIMRTFRPASSVQIIDAEGREISRANTDINGMASIIFIPRLDASYFARMVGGSAKVSLPATESDGCSLLLTTTGRSEEPVKILIGSPPASHLRDVELSFIVTMRGRIYHSGRFTQGTKDFVALQIPQENLPEGIAHFSLLDHNGELLASRDFYTPGIEAVQVNLEPSKHEFQIREKASVEISLTDSKGKPITGEFSVSVRNAALFNSEKQNSLSDELNIFSDKKERFFVDRTDANWLTALDNYLICFPEAIPWKKILSGENGKPTFPFTSVVQKTGRAFLGDTLGPVPDFTQIMFYLQKDKWHYQTFTLEKGKFRLTIPDLYGLDEFFYMAETKDGKEVRDLKIVWENENVTLPRSPVSLETQNPDRYASFASKSRLINKSFGLFTDADGLTDDNRKSKNSRDHKNEIVAADITVNVQDYIIFPTMIELLREVVPSLRCRKAGGKDIVRVSLPEAMIVTADPVYIIDGIATKNTAFFLSLKPADVLTVKIVRDEKKLMRLGLMGKNGIVIVQTKNGDLRESLNDPSKLIVGLNKPVNFKAVRARAEDRTKPDFRSTVYWDPTVKTDKNGKVTVTFFCSDDIGKLTIRVDGIAGGQAFSAGQEIEVIESNKK